MGAGDDGLLDEFEGQWYGVELPSAFWAAGDVEAGEAQDLLSAGFFGSLVVGLRRRGLADGSADGFEGFLSVGVGEEAEEADFMEAGRENVEREAAYKLMGVEGDGVDLFLFAVFGAEGDFGVFDVFDAVVMDGDAVGVATEVIKDLLGTAERSLCIDGPAFLFGGVEQSMEGGRIGERRELSVEAEAPGVEEAEQSVAVLRGKDAAECSDGKEEVGLLGANKFFFSQDACGDDDMQVKVIHEFLVPRMQNSNEAGLSFELPFGFGGEAFEGFVYCLEEQAERGFFVLEDEGIKFVREGEDAVEVGNVEQLGTPGFEPFLFGGGLAFRTMTVATGVVGRALKAALGAAVEVPVECGGAADAYEVERGADVRRLGMRLKKRIAVQPQHFRHLEGRTVHEGAPLEGLER